MQNKVFVDLGQQPVANDYIIPGEDPRQGTFFNLAMARDKDTGLCTLIENIPHEEVYDETYVYHSSGSETMRKHFRNAAKDLDKLYGPKRVLEIGSNDGAFLFNWEPSVAESVEPCGNFAEITSEAGYFTLPNFWDYHILSRLGGKKYDLIYSANCICHIEDIDQTFYAASESLTEDGVFVFEDPSLLQMLKRGSYDQLYVEHVHMFSVFALQRALRKAGLEIIRVEHLDVHGGSNRIHASKIAAQKFIDSSVERALKEEIGYGIHSNRATDTFGERVLRSKSNLVNMLKTYKEQGKKIVSYGATAKSVTVFNYCGIGPDLIDYIIDNTKAKQGKLQPGTGIPVQAPENGDRGIAEDVDIVFLGAWNFSKEILEKEKDFIKRGGIFVTHVPNPMELTSAEEHLQLVK